MEKIYCPFCGSEHYHEFENRYECEECGWLFDEHEIEWQNLRHEISHYLIDTDEEHPIVFDENSQPIIGEKWPETIGMSTLNMFHCDKIFQIPGDGTIWIHIDGEYDKTDPTGLKWRDIEFFTLDDIREIVNALEFHKKSLVR